MANMMKLFLPLLVVLLVSTDALELPSLGKTFGKRLSKGLGGIFEKILSKLPFKIPSQFLTPTPTAAPSSERSPPFCSTYDCPHFYEMKVNSSVYKLRCYPKPYTWVSTTVVGESSRQAGKTAFWRLFRYIQGRNEEDMKIKMTVPVTKQMQLDQTSNAFCKENVTVSFFIPFKHQKDAPLPTEQDVHLTVVKPFCAYVNVYGGWATTKMVQKQYEALVKALKTDNLGDDFPSDTFYTAGYDEPWKKIQHNEVWVFSKRHRPVPDNENEEVDTL